MGRTVREIWVQVPSAEASWHPCELTLDASGHVVSLALLGKEPLTADFPERLRVIDTSTEPYTCSWFFIKKEDNTVYRFNYNNLAKTASGSVLGLEYVVSSGRIDPSFTYNQSEYEQLEAGIDIVTKQKICPLTLDMLSSIAVRPADAVTRTRLLDEVRAEESRESFLKKLQEDYQTKVFTALSALFESYQDDLSSMELTRALKAYLRENWILTQGTPLAYTALPKHPVTMLLVAIANNIAAKTGVCALQCLMPGILVESIDQKYLYLNAQPLDTLLNTHILSEDHRYLLPVKLLLATPDAKGLVNPYYDVIDAPDSSLYITPLEYQRLATHSGETYALVDAQKAYDEAMYDEKSLLGQLNLFCYTLSKYDAHGGIGRQDNAAAGAYQPIISFMGYYEKLNASDKGRIPKVVRDEIEYFQTLASDPTQNRNRSGAGNRATCIGTRREMLQLAMRGHTQILNDIRLDETVQATHLATCEDALKRAKDDLREAMSDQNYAGYDKLSITNNLLQAFNRPFTIASPYELNLLQAMRPQEIRTLLQDNTTRQENVIKQWDDVGDLVMFITETPSESVRAVLETLAVPLTCTFVNHLKLIVQLLCALNSEKTQVVCEALKEVLLSMIIEYPKYIIRDFFFKLLPEQCTIFCKALPELFVLIPELLAFLLKSDGNLSPEQRTALYNAFKHQWSGVIKTAFHFRNLLEVLSEEQRTEVYEQFKGQFSALIQSSKDFSQVLKFLSPEQRLAVYKEVQDKLPALIQSSKDFSRVLKRFLIREDLQKVDPFKAFSVQFEDLSAAIYLQFQDQIPEWLKPGEDNELNIMNLVYVLQCIPIAQFEAFKNIVPERLGVELLAMSGFTLSPERFEAVVKMIKDRLPTIIPSSKDLFRLLVRLPPERCQFVCDELKEHLLTIITSVDDVIMVLEGLSPDQRRVVLKALSVPLSKILPSFYANYLSNTLLDLSEICLKYCTSLKKLRDSMSSPVVLARTLDLLFNDRNDLYEDHYSVLKEIVPQILRSPQDLASFLESIQSADYVNAVFRRIKSINNSHRWVDMIYNVINEKIPTLIKSINDLKSLEALGVLKISSICTQVCLQLPLSDMIQSVDDFIDVLRIVPTDQFVSICTQLQTKGFFNHQVWADLQAKHPLPQNYQYLVHAATKLGAPVDFFNNYLDKIKDINPKPSANYILDLLSWAIDKGCLSVVVRISDLSQRKYNDSVRRYDFNPYAEDQTIKGLLQSAETRRQQAVSRLWWLGVSQQSPDYAALEAVTFYLITQHPDRPFDLNTLYENMLVSLSGVAPNTEQAIIEMTSMTSMPSLRLDNIANLPPSVQTRLFTNENNRIEFKSEAIKTYFATRDPEGTQTISKQDFQDILATYKTTALWNYFNLLWFVGLRPSTKSKTMQALELLLQTEGETISRCAVSQAIYRGENREYRHQLLKETLSEARQETTSTDEVIKKLNRKFNPSP